MMQDEKILKAAFEMFLRYGVKASSMAQIAEAAEVSRQTLYNSFGSKDEMLRALIKWYYANAQRRLREIIDATKDLSARLNCAFDVVAREPFAVLQKSPNAADLISGMNAVSRDEIAAGAEAVQALIAEALHGYVLERQQNDLSRLIFLSAKSIKENALSDEILETDLETLFSLVKSSAAIAAKTDE